MALSRRPRLLDIAPDLPPYLLLPEIQQILDVAKDGHVYFFLDTLWHTGARISEALALTASSFHLDGVENSDVILRTLKQRNPGRPRKGVSPPAKRLIPLPYPAYLERVTRYLATHKPKPGERIFRYTDRYYRKQIESLVEPLALPIPVTPHTFRHSYAVNLLLHGRDIRLVQQLLGHKSLKSTLVYTQVLAGDTHHLLADVQFD